MGPPQPDRMAGQVDVSGKAPGPAGQGAGPGGSHQFGLTAAMALTTVGALAFVAIVGLFYIKSANFMPWNVSKESAVAVFGIVPTSKLANATAPFSDAVNAMFGGTWAGNVLGVAVISGFGALNGWTMICAEMPKAAADDGLFPERFKPKDVWEQRVRLLTPYQVNASLLEKSGNQAVKFMHCLPAFHDTNTVVGKEIMEHTGMTSGLEVTDEVFQSGASIVSTRPRTGCTRRSPQRPAKCR
jgi:hypothetical protein